MDSDCRRRAVGDYQRRPIEVTPALQNHLLAPERLIREESNGVNAGFTYRCHRGPVVVVRTGLVMPLITYTPPESALLLAAGYRVGPYEIRSTLGVGGMGEVHRAHDVRLQRDVALKLLPEPFASDPDRLARFRREALVLASLSHANIAAIHGIEEDAASRVHALVLELVDGPTLADRIASGRMPLDELRAVARQIIEALHAAHERGVIHRDLKPSNIKIRDDITVKVLDFGLAKMLDTASPVEASIAPTITSPAATGMGVILGTAAYMAPEQARGQTADIRADIWAFGVVLYEMLTGVRPFEGGTAPLGKDLLTRLLNQPTGVGPLEGTRSLIKSGRGRVGDGSLAAA